MTYRYMGGGYIPGVPTRDLTDEEAAEYRVTANPLYERITRKRSYPDPLPQGEVLPEPEEDNDG